MLVFSVIFILIAPIALTFVAILLNQAPLFDPPGFLTRLKTYLTTNIAHTSEDHPFPELRTQKYDVPADALYQKVLDAVQNQGWTIEESDQSARRIKAVVISPLWRFRDDIDIQIEQTQMNQSSLGMRSSSRVGRGDLGANAGHILCLLKLLKEQS